MVVASLVPSKATLPPTIGGGAKLSTTGNYPFDDDVTVVVDAPKALRTLVRIPGWASQATVDGKPAANGTMCGSRARPRHRTLVLTAPADTAPCSQSRAHAVPFADGL